MNHLAESQVKTVKGITELDKVNSTTSIMDVKFTDESSAKYISTYSSALNFIDKEVIVELRDDFFQGKIVPFIAQLTVTSVTNVISREADMKLYTEDTGETYATVAFGDIPEAGAIGAILFCTNVKFEKSDRAYWCTLTCLDRNRRSCQVRLFEPDRDTANYINRYVEMNIKKRKTFFNATKVSIRQGLAPAANPEIQLAKTFILDVVKDEKFILEFLEKTKLLEYIEKYNFDEVIEPGYEMVRLAIEIEMIRNLKNVTKDLDISAMLKYAIVRRGYCTTHNEDTVKSKNVQNLYFAIQNGLIKSKLDMCLLDKESEKVVPEKEILEDFHSLANKIALVNRTYFYDKL